MIVVECDCGFCVSAKGNQEHTVSHFDGCERCAGQGADCNGTELERYPQAHWDGSLEQVDDRACIPNQEANCNAIELEERTQAHWDGSLDQAGGRVCYPFRARNCNTIELAECTQECHDGLLAQVDGCSRRRVQEVVAMSLNWLQDSIHCSKETGH